MEEVRVFGQSGGSLPVIDCSETITGWTQPDAITYPNVWSKAITHEIAADTSRIAIYEDNGTYIRPLVSQTSVATTNSTAASRYSPSDASLTTNNPATVYIHTSDSANPNTNGKAYYATVRDYAFAAGGGSHIEGVHTRFNASNNGSIVLGIGTAPTTPSLLRRGISEFGTKHNALTNCGEVSDYIFYGLDYHTASEPTNGMLVWYTPDPTGLTSTMRNVGFLGGLDAHKRFWSAAVVQHGNLGNVYTAAYGYGIWLSEISLPELGSATTVTMDGVYGTLLGRGVFTGGATSIIRRALMDLDADADNPIVPVAAATYENCGIVADNEGTSTSFIRVQNASVILTITNCVYFNPAGQNRVFLTELNGPHNPTLAFTKTVFVIQGNTAFISPVGATYTGNYNVFHRRESGTFGATYNGVDYSTLATWQAATGQDAQSVYLTVPQMAAFFLGNPENGDFRINPNAQVTGADGTVYTGTFPDATPITQAGIQSRWNWNTRASVSGAPTAWPTVPSTRAECLTYLQAPLSWNFHP